MVVGGISLHSRRAFMGRSAIASTASPHSTQPLPFKKNKNVPPSTEAQLLDGLIVFLSIACRVLGPVRAGGCMPIFESRWAVKDDAGVRGGRLVRWAMHFIPTPPRNRSRLISVHPHNQSIKQALTNHRSKSNGAGWFGPPRAPGARRRPRPAAVRARHKQQASSHATRHAAPSERRRWRWQQ